MKILLLCQGQFFSKVVV